PFGAQRRRGGNGARRCPGAGGQDRPQSRAEDRGGDPRRRGRCSGRGRGRRRGRGAGRGRSSRDRRMTPAASIGGWNIPLPDPVVGAIVDVVILLVAGLGAWFIARLVAQQLRQRHVRGDMVVLGRRVATGVVVMAGICAALGYTAQNPNVTRFGLLLASIVA